MKKDLRESDIKYPQSVCVYVCVYVYSTETIDPFDTLVRLGTPSQHNALKCIK